MIKVSKYTIDVKFYQVVYAFTLQGVITWVDFSWHEQVVIANGGCQSGGEPAEVTAQIFRVAITTGLDVKFDVEQGKGLYAKANNEEEQESDSIWHQLD